MSFRGELSKNLKPCARAAPARKRERRRALGRERAEDE